MRIHIKTIMRRWYITLFWEDDLRERGKYPWKMTQETYLDVN